MSKNELFFPSNDGITNIHMVTWEPEGEVTGIVQIVHGITEHIGRYEEFAKYLNDKGLFVVGIDLLGHGMSTNNGSKSMYFGGVGSFDYVVEDINHALKQVKNMYPDVPYTMLGFSLGSFLVRKYMIKYPGVVDANVLVGTGTISSFEYKIASSIVKKETRKYGDSVATEKIRDLTFGTYNKKFKPNRTELDWLCGNEESLDEFLVDPLRGENITVGLFRELLDGMYYTNDRNNLNGVNKNKPVLLLSGAEDAVGGMGKGIVKSANLLKSVGISDVTYKIYEGLRHDILHELSRDVIYEDIFEWLRERRLVLPVTKRVVETPVTLVEDDSRELVSYDEVEHVWPELVKEHSSIRRR